ncbi:MAG: hypothetical protein VR69_12640 [Peptococcaceae bacterium BRH_c4b]|nr:MAG: hypothetical protein VR69_12640 [Peptococcaceae bacterium BRH_c4b]
MLLTDDFLNEIFEKARPVVERKCKNANIALREDRENILSTIRYMYQNHLDNGFDPASTLNMEAFLLALTVQTWFSLCNT